MNEVSKGPTTCSSPKAVRLNTGGTRARASSLGSAKGPQAPSPWRPLPPPHPCPGAGRKPPLRLSATFPARGATWPETSETLNRRY